jgi:hypothetical protein
LGVVERTGGQTDPQPASIYSFATAMNGLPDEADLRLRFDVLAKTKRPSSTVSPRAGDEARSRDAETCFGLRPST